jgi:hypothetical protein
MPQLQKLNTNNTTIKTEQNGGTKYRIVTYYTTEIVRWKWVTKEVPVITLDTGGWSTVSTKNRMNQTSNQYSLGFKVYSHKKDWFVSSIYYNKEFKFVDGMVF